MKKLCIVLSLALVLSAICLIGCSMPNNQAKDTGNEVAAVFTLDVNPGIRVYVKQDNTVIKIEPTNEDGEEIVQEIDFEGKDFEAVVENVIDEMSEKGYLEDENNSILISLEKEEIDISEKLNKQVNKSFEKHGKKVAIIEQDLKELDKEIEESVEKISKEHNISKGKAHLVGKIREEFPEISEEELVELNVNDLNHILEDTTEDVKQHFEKIDKPADDTYIGREAALETALESLDATLEKATMNNVRMTKGTEGMLYVVKIVFGETEHEITINAESGEIISSESKEYVEINAKEVIDEFCNENNINKDAFKGELEVIVGDKHHKPHVGDENRLTKGEILKVVFDYFEISEKKLSKTDVNVHADEENMVYSVTVRVEDGYIYKVVVEAFSGVLIKAEVNGEEVAISVNKAE